MALRDERVWIFLDGVYERFSARSVDGYKTPGNKGTSAGTGDAKDTDPM
jgi:hypothetical protein